MTHVLTIPNSSFEVAVESIDCPHCCTTIVPNLLSATSINSYPHNVIAVLSTCVDSSCGLPFLLEFKQKYKARDLKWKEKPYSLQGIYDYEYVAELPDDLEVFRDEEQRPYLSTFFEIYEQSHRANEIGLSDVAGGGYRKALEFLMKDYAKHCFPTEELKISKETLAAVIGRFTDNVTLQTVSRRASWLGNDQVHYYKTWELKDIDDMIQLIHSSVYWICQNEIAKQLLSDMPDKQR